MEASKAGRVGGTSEAGRVEGAASEAGRVEEEESGGFIVAEDSRGTGGRGRTEPGNISFWYSKGETKREEEGPYR